MLRFRGQLYIFALKQIMLLRPGFPAVRYRLPGPLITAPFPLTCRFGRSADSLSLARFLPRPEEEADHLQQRQSSPQPLSQWMRGRRAALKPGRLQGQVDRSHAGTDDFLEVVLKDFLERLKDNKALSGFVVPQ